MRATLLLLIGIMLFNPDFMVKAENIGAGIGVDRSGGPTIDPTKNVLDLVAASVKRLDDLRIASDILTQAKVDSLKENAELRDESVIAKMDGLKELSDLRATHEKELRISEAARLDEIRKYDREEVSKTAASAQTAIATLAKQTTDLSTTLAKQVQDTAVATEQRQTVFATEVNKRLQALELSASERTGKQQVFDPQISQLSAVVEKLAASRNETQGQWTLIIVLIAAGGLVMGVVGFIYRKRSENGLPPKR